MILGYKAFNDDCTNRYGQKFEVGKIYDSCDEVIKFRSTGFHFCKNLEDTLRYYDGFSNIKIAEVVGIGKIDYYEDNYYGYYNMYSAERMYILKFLSREEIYQYILDIAKNSSLFTDRVIRFVEGYKINDEERNGLISAVSDDNQRKRLVKAIKYYQDGIKDVYK